MKAFRRVLTLAVMLMPAAALATKVPIPVDGATLNVSIQLQPEVQINGGGSPDGTSPSYDVFVRRTRLLVNGDMSQNFTYLIQLDNANFGKFGNFSFRGIVQDAWVGWAPTGITGGTVVYIDAGILLEPLSHNYLESTTNFITADVTADPFKIAGNTYAGLRSPGVQTRGWALDKTLGWRGGVYEGVTPFDGGAAGTSLGVSANGSVVGIVPTGATACTASGKGAGTCITPKRAPQFSGYVGYDIIGSEEGSWLYGAYKWGDKPILSIGVAAYYQSLATKNVFGSLTDTRLLNADAYLNLPMGDSELVAEFTFYNSFNGTGSANTGNGFSAQLGYRWGWVAPYAAYEYYQAASCPDASSGNYTAAQIAACSAAAEGNNPDTQDSRNFRAGLNFFMNKNFNHLNLEFQVNHGTSTYGAQSMTVANNGYVPNINNGAPANTLLRSAATYSMLMHWNVFF